MRRRFEWIVVLGSLIAGLFAAQAWAGGPDWRNFIPFEPRVEYDAQKSYAIHQGNGPWMILAASFSGEQALPQAKTLLKELRTRYNVQAYIHRRDFDYNEKVLGKGFAKGTNEPLTMKYLNDGVSQQYVVLVGNFPTVDDPEVERTLKKLKYAKPKALQIHPERGTSQNLAILREVQRAIHPESDRQQRGPMASAFVTRNPLLPQEFFNPQGVDSFVYSINRDVEHSLLKNPGKFTVKVASFRGKSTMSATEAQSFSPTNKLEMAADNAHRLTVALRKKGVEAYEFHDRHESIVTIGSFDKVGDPRIDGRTELLPAIHQIMMQYGPQKQKVRGGQVGLMPKTLAGIPFDVQPLPIVVPKRSIANDYNRAGQLGLLR